LKEYLYITLPTYLTLIYLLPYLTLTLFLISNLTHLLPPAHPKYPYHTLLVPLSGVCIHLLLVSYTIIHPNRKEGGGRKRQCHTVTDICHSQLPDKVYTGHLVPDSYYVTHAIVSLSLWYSNCYLNTNDIIITVVVHLHYPTSSSLPYFIFTITLTIIHYTTYHCSNASGSFPQLLNATHILCEAIVSIWLELSLLVTLELLKSVMSTVA
jgi:hypothetical protein